MVFHNIKYIISKKRTINSFFQTKKDFHDPQFHYVSNHVREDIHKTCTQNKDLKGYSEVAWELKYIWYSILQNVKHNLYLKTCESRALVHIIAKSTRNIMLDEDDNVKRL